MQKIPYTFAIAFLFFIRIRIIVIENRLPDIKEAGESPRLPEVTLCLKPLNKASGTSNYIPGLFIPEFVSLKPWGSPIKVH
jgi:hypothetical protein